MPTMHRKLILVDEPTHAGIMEIKRFSPRIREATRIGILLAEKVEEELRKEREAEKGAHP